MKNIGFLILVLLSFCSTAFAQTNTTPWPPNPPVGIGTVGSGAPLNALHIHHNPTNSATWPAILRLSDGDTTNSTTFGILGLMDAANTGYCSLSRGNDLILHENQGGDLLLTNFTDWGGGAIR